MENNTEEKLDVARELRNRAKKYRIRANYSLVLIIAFFAVGIWIFMSANNIATQEAELLRSQRMQADSLNLILRQQNDAIEESILKIDSLNRAIY